MGRSTASICLTDRDDMRLQNAYARGSDVYSQLGIGMQERRIDSFSLQRKPRKSNVRLAVVMPWVVDAANSFIPFRYSTPLRNRNLKEWFAHFEYPQFHLGGHSSGCLEGKGWCISGGQSEGGAFCGLVANY